MPRYKLTVAYDGTAFNGWQKQRRERPQEVADERAVAAESPEDQSAAGGESNRAAPHSDETARQDRPPTLIRTVQAVLERAVQRVIGEPVIVVGASRTDSGVHARGQVAAFTSSRTLPTEKLPRAISSRLPDDVRVIKAEIVDEAFDPIRGAIAKGYRYRLAFGCHPHQMPLFSRHHVGRHPHALDPVRMNLAARLMLGEHDFASFARISHGRESTVRTVYECKVDQTSAHRLQLDVAGNGFLYNMVRIIMGTLIEVGRGRIEPEAIPEIIAARDRRAAGPTAPPTGLCLMWIRYGEPRLESGASEAGAASA